MSIVNDKVNDAASIVEQKHFPYRDYGVEDSQDSETPGGYGLNESNAWIDLPLYTSRIQAKPTYSQS